MKLLVLVMSVLFLTPAHSQTCSITINQQKELLIVDPSVVDDPRATRGVWSFAHIMAVLNAHKHDLSDFTLHWLQEWTTKQTVNGFAVEPRPTVNNLINGWPKLPNGKLDMSRAPFRLLAIVNRVDLSSAPAGEGRFVYGLLDPQGRPLPFTVIFEFVLPVSQFNNPVPVIAWAKTWHQLGNIPFGESFNQALEKITGAFARPGTINQVRTNEIVFGPTWQMREFTLGLNGHLESSPTKQMPDEAFVDSPDLANWIRLNAETINAGAHVVPLRTIGGTGHAPRSWAPSLANDPNPAIRSARRNFSIQTCTGCHSSDTNTAFLHVEPRAAGPSKISNFLIADLNLRVEKMKQMLCFTPGEVARRLRMSTRVH